MKSSMLYTTSLTVWSWKKSVNSHWPSQKGPSNDFRSHRKNNWRPVSWTSGRWYWLCDEWLVCLWQIAMWLIVTGHCHQMSATSSVSCRQHMPTMTALPRSARQYSCILYRNDTLSLRHLTRHSLRPYVRLSVCLSVCHKPVFCESNKNVITDSTPRDCVQ